MILVDQYIKLIVPEHNSGLLVPPLAPILARANIVEGHDGVRVSGSLQLGNIAVTEYSDIVHALGTSGTSSVLLLHLDGLNGATTTTDVYGNTITFVGSAALSTAQSKFGPSSLQISSVGSNGINCGNAPSLNLPSNWTVELFVYLQAYPAANNNIYTKHVSSLNFTGFGAFINTSGQITINVGTPSTIGNWDYTSSASPALSLNTWHHFALVGQAISGSEVYAAYLDGVQWSTATGGAASGPGNDGGSVVFGDQVQGISCPCFLDEIRMSPVARYTANFTPPTSPFTF